MKIKYFNIIMESLDDGNKLSIINNLTNECKIIKVVNDTERKYCYKCQKTQIKTMYKNATGLLEEFKKAIEDGFMETMISCVASVYGVEVDYTVSKL